MIVKYTCARYPELGIGPIKFANGEFVTDDPGLQALVESSFYAAHIRTFAVTLDEPSASAEEVRESVPLFGDEAEWHPASSPVEPIERPSVTALRKLKRADLIEFARSRALEFTEDITRADVLSLILSKVYGY